MRGEVIKRGRVKRIDGKIVAARIPNLPVGSEVEVDDSVIVRVVRHGRPRKPLHEQYTALPGENDIEWFK